MKSLKTQETQVANVSYTGWYSLFIYLFLIFIYFLTSFVPCGQGIWVALPGQGYSSRKSSATHSHQCVHYFRCTVVMAEQWYGCQCLGFLTCSLMLMHAIAHGGCTNAERESALKADSGRLIPCRTGGLIIVSIALGFWPTALPTGLPCSCC